MRRTWRKYLEFTILTLAGIFILRTLTTGWPQLASALTTANWLLLFLAWPVFLLYFAFRATAWSLLIRFLGYPRPALATAQIWFLSEFGRYIPGSVWSFAARVTLTEKQNIPKKITLISLLLEAILLVGTACFFMIGLLMSPETIGLKLSSNWLLLPLLPLLIIILVPQLLATGANWLLARLKRPAVEFQLSRGQLFLTTLFFLLAWATYGFASFLTMIAFTGTTSISPFWLIAAHVVAWLIGYLSLITPMGLGVREGALIALLSPLISPPLASLVAVSTRLWLIVAELSALLIFSLSSLQRGVHSLSRLWQRAWREHRFETLPVLGILLFIAYFTTFTFIRHTNFHTARYDLGIMDQTVWNTAQGRILELTNPVGTETIVRFAIHSDAFLALLAPLYWIIPSPYTLLFIQVLIVALGALPLYWLAVQIIKYKPLALILAYGYLLFPPLERAVIFDFHSVTLASTFILFAFYFLYNRRYWLFALFALLTLSTKETMSFMVIALGLYALLAQRNWKVGLATMGLGSLWFYLMLWHIMPGSRLDGTTHFALGYYDQYGHSPGEILKTMLFKPYVWLQDLLTVGQARYLSWFIVPTGFLALLSPVILLAAPEFAINMLSNNELMRTFYYQYGAALTALIFASAVFGAATLMRRIKWISPQILTAYLLLVTIFTVWRWSPLPGMRMADTAALTPNFPGREYIQSLKQTIPADAVVSATNKLAPHFSHRQHLYLVPNGIGEANYILTARNDTSELITPEQMNEMIEILRLDERYETVYKNEVVEIFKKK